MKKYAVSSGESRAVAAGRNKNSTLRRMKKYSMNYFFILPGLILLFLFAYRPLYGLQIAFKNFDLSVGYWDSPWCGLANFRFLKDMTFWNSVANTVIISVLRTIICFPAAIIIALMLNEVRQEYVKKALQTVSYLPHFVSWIIVAYMLTALLSLDTGSVNVFFKMLGLSQVNFMGQPKYFRGLIVLSSLWKDTGWNTILYLAALANIDAEVLEAAVVDGAGRFARIWHINIPGIMPTIMILLILSVPGILSAGYDQIYPLVNPTNMSVSNVLDVYIINLGFTNGQFSISSAIGLLKALISLGLVVGVNGIVKKFGQEGLI